VTYATAGKGIEPLSRKGDEHLRDLDLQASALGVTLTVASRARGPIIGAR
jgi:hypothetical protein